MSPFAYAGNNPILFNDPTGLLKATTEELFNFINEAFEGSGGTWSDDGGQQMFESDQQAAIWALSNLGSLGGGINVNAESQLAGIAGGGTPLREVTITVDKYNNYHGEPYWSNTWLHKRLDEAFVDPFDFTYALDDTQTVLDGIGLAPGAGEFADGLNAIIYLARGDKTNAALSATAMIPIVGWVATSSKLANKAHIVYTGVKNGQRYIGITTDLNQRYTKAERAAMQITELYTNVPSRNLARGIEQTLINQYGLGNLANKINSISPAKQLGKHKGTMDAAKIFMLNY